MTDRWEESVVNVVSTIFRLYEINLSFISLICPHRLATATLWNTQSAYSPAHISNLLLPSETVTLTTGLPQRGAAHLKGPNLVPVHRVWGYNSWILDVWRHFKLFEDLNTETRVLGESLEGKHSQSSRKAGPNGTAYVVKSRPIKALLFLDTCLVSLSLSLSLFLSHTHTHIHAKSDSLTLCKSLLFTLEVIKHQTKTRVSRVSQTKHTREALEGWWCKW